MDLLSRNNVHVLRDYRVSIPVRWKILQKKDGSMVNDASRLVERGVMCNTHAQYLVRSYLLNLPVLSGNRSEILPAAEGLGIKVRRTLYGGELIFCYKPH